MGLGLTPKSKKSIWAQLQVFLVFLVSDEIELESRNPHRAQLKQIMATENKPKSSASDTTNSKKRKQRYLPHNVSFFYFLSMHLVIYMQFVFLSFDCILYVFLYCRNQWGRRVPTHYTQEFKASLSLVMGVGSAKPLVRLLTLLNLYAPFSYFLLLFIFCCKIQAGDMENRLI